MVVVAPAAVLVVVARRPVVVVVVAVERQTVGWPLAVPAGVGHSPAAAAGPQLVGPSTFELRPSRSVAEIKS